VNAAAEHLINVPPSHDLTVAVAVILAAIALFAVVFVSVFLVALRRDRAEGDA
jgi:hypothetical protein